MSTPTSEKFAIILTVMSIHHKVWGSYPECWRIWMFLFLSNGTSQFDSIGLTSGTSTEWMTVSDVNQIRFSLRPGIQMSAEDGSWISDDLLSTRLRHFWSSPPAIGWPWSSQLPMCETCFVQDRSFAYASPSNWNSLPVHLRDNSLSLSSFKRHLKTFLFSFY